MKAALARVSAMELRRAGKSGLSLSRLGLGTMTWGRDTDTHEAADQCRAYIEAGGNFFDTSSTYGDGDSERVIGGLIGTLFKREDVAIATKAGENGKIFGSVNTVQLADALRALGFDIDRKSLKIKDEPIREIGTYEVEANLYKGVRQAFKFEVVSE